MKRLVFIVGLGLAACGDGGSRDVSGWIEADPTFYAAETGGRVAEIVVKPGDAIKPGDILARMDATFETNAVQAAEARVAEAEARLARVRAALQSDPQLAVLDAQVKQARAKAALSQQMLERKRALRGRGSISQADLDAAEAQWKADNAAVEASARAADAGRAGGRNEDVMAAEAGVALAKAQLADASERAARRVIVAAAAGMVQDTYFRVGETVVPARPVVAVLSPDQVKLRFFVSGELKAGLALGGAIDARCDGCTEIIRARISFIDTSAQYTPPVIYSESERAKLVYLVEAVPEQAEKLHPGLPVTVTLK